MNVLSERARGWRKGRKRGVSPIIATILLVAITVVLAAVLYVLVSGLTRTGASTPYQLGIQTTPGGATGSGSSWFDSLTLSPTTGLTTSMFGLTIASASSVTYPLQAVTGSACTPGSTYATSGTGACAGTAGGWFGVLISGTTIAATYSVVSGTATWTYASGTTTIALNNGYNLVVISAAQLNGLDYTITVYSTGSSSVSGSGIL